MAALALLRTLLARIRGLAIIGAAVLPVRAAGKGYRYLFHGKAL